jgi:hypothetical protein
LTVLMFQERFAAPILAGTKRQTIRPPRKRPIDPGDELSLRRWEGKAYRSIQVEIKTVKVLAVLGIRIDDCGLIRIFDRCFETLIEEFDHISDLDHFARGDGFTTWSDMRSYWLHCSSLPFTGELIQWE